MASEAQRGRLHPWLRFGVQVLLGFLVCLGCAWYLLGVSDARRGRLLKIGQTEEEVYEIMGEEQALEGDGETITVYHGRRVEGLANLSRRFHRWTGVWLYRPQHEDWPIAIRFDANGRVDRIKRGNEIVERENAQPTESK